ncbi:MAG: class I SAM-dependent methyltransferase [Candidatus Promineifilaceae bacterium]|jgi:ubiquinone/menaquinone biosynthesis C-methylase UbiE
MNEIEYDSIARLYDIYASTDYDFAFFTNEVAQDGPKVLELTSGTGRISIQLIEAGADLTCVDISQGMLDVLTEKLTSLNYSARVLCSDIEQLSFKLEFDLAIFPFQSFMELIGSEKQLNALLAIYRSLKLGGRFMCTLHNPVVRRRSADGVLRLVGRFQTGDGMLVVSGFEEDRSPVVERSQLFEYSDKSGILEWKRLLNMHFELIEKEAFEEMASKVGFKMVELFGNYDYTPFSAKHSPVMIWVLQKP